MSQESHRLPAFTGRYLRERSAFPLLSVVISGNAVRSPFWAIAHKNHELVIVKNMLKELRHYVEQHVEANYKDNKPIFLSSGFEVAPNSRPAPPPLSRFIRRIDPGRNSGSLFFTLVAIAGASLYQLRWAPVGTSYTDGEWTIQLITKTRPATEIKGLIPGTNYVFQVRAMIGDTFTDWSDPIARICT